MMGFIRKLMLLPRLLKILKLIDPKKLKGLNDILERVYPGIKDEIERLVEHRDIHAMTKTLDYVKAHGGYEKIAEYYNNADQKGQDEMLSAFNEAFRPGAPFEDAVLTLDGLAKVKDMGLYTQLLGDVKDSIVMTSIKLGYRTIDDWRTFVRRQREANKVVQLGILEEIQEDEETENNENVEEENTDQSNEETGNGSQYSFSKDLISELYEYNNVVFKRISSKYEFACIIQRKPHKEKLVECSGKKVLAYHILWRLRNLLPEDSREEWINDIAVECGYGVTNISKKYKDETNMRPENKKLLGELSSLFDDYETKI
jgi:bacterioferritin (cytochrome b1)